MTGNLYSMGIDFQYIRSLLGPLRDWVAKYGPAYPLNFDELEGIAEERTWAVVAFDSEELRIRAKCNLSEFDDIMSWIETSKPYSDEHPFLGVLCEVRFFTDLSDLQTGIAENEDQRIEAYIDLFNILDDDSDENIKRNIGFYDF